MTPQPPSSLCPLHTTPASGVCARCGRFGCGSCLSGAEEPWCTDCLARPEARLTPSPEAKRALLMALLGFHGLVPLLAVAAWSSLAELERIGRDAAPAAGRPWAQGALGISVLGLVLWAIVALFAF